MSKENLQAEFSMGLSMINSKVSSWLEDASKKDDTKKNASDAESKPSKSDHFFLEQPIIRQGSGLSFSNVQENSTVADFIQGKDVKREKKKQIPQSRSFSVLEKKIQKTKAKNPQRVVAKRQIKPSLDVNSDEEDDVPVRKAKTGSNLMFEKKIKK
ncbi:unnamed protein product [Kuraishia capsulata CBS 1993]|uniref:Uncharacterized protein n=1 Tax=Kuraishia capsulata CBS 1993 TaxID=1382522 RepID=W6MRY9_9ASCO|nr:uncharacterized protein KUCA_T00005513001 [Kuraishia capsulata CBS 1993]CDK29521.1 unnamed protein product [Kuraishia capsulata CBS 1993]